MLFHTWPFLLFFLVVLVLSRWVRSPRWLMWLWFLSSYFFYGCGVNDRGISNWWFVPLLLYSTWIDYAAVQWMHRSGPRGRRWLLALCLLNNLLVLGVFKYAAFVARNINGVLELGGFGARLAVPDWILPIGISFFTFQSMSYTIDYYLGAIEREPSFIRFAAFVSLFPQLVAGPIERAGALLPQLRHPRLANRRDFASGASLFLTGLFKKVALADYLSLYVDPIYANPSAHGAPALWLATFAFAWQIYFDFSGYTDMARGAARALGIELMLNFRHPYLAVDMADFWLRWHISLSQWFRDYVYIPLGGGRGTEARVARNLMLVFVISGFWHGANWKFVVWGAVHGVAAIAWRSFARKPGWTKLPRLVKQLLVFLVVCLAWVFFRARTLSSAMLILGRMFAGPWTDPRFPWAAGALVAAVWIYQSLLESRWEKAARWGPLQVLLAASMIVYLCLFAGGREQSFIYFQF